MIIVADILCKALCNALLIKIRPIPNLRKFVVHWGEKDMQTDK